MNAREKPSKEELVDLLGKPVHVSKIFIHGLWRTKDDFAKDVSKKIFETQTVGECLINVQEVQSMFNSLNVTKGVRVLVDVSDDGTDGLLVHLNLAEKSRWAGAVKGFMGNDADAKVGVGGGLNINGLFPNFLGRGEKISCCWQQAIHNSRKEILFQKPVGTGYSSIVSSSLHNYSGQVLLSGYQEDHTGASLDLMIPHGEFNHKLSWTGVWRQLLALNSKTAWAVREQAGHSLKSSLKYEFTYDNRDDYVLPSDGQLFRLTQELAGLGGDCSFYSKQLTLQINKQLPMDDRVVLQLGCSVGHVQPIDLFKVNKYQKPLSILDKFYLGGPTSLRGFENKGIGPRQQDNALGADFYWQGYANLRMPLPGVRGTILDRLRPQIFVNCGNCMDWSSGTSMSQLFRQHVDTARLTYGVGMVTNFFGARMELNYCIPVKYQQQDQVKHGFQFGISVGD